MSDPLFPLFHWSPTSRRARIVHRGMMPGSWSTDRLWKPPLVCFARDPEMAWDLSAGTPRGQLIDSWDLWVMWSDVPSGYEEIVDHWPDTGVQYVKEYRIYERIFKKDLWFAGTRTQEGQRG